MVTINNREYTVIDPQGVHPIALDILEARAAQGEPILYEHRCPLCKAALYAKAAKKYRRCHSVCATHGIKGQVFSPLEKRQAYENAFQAYQQRLAWRDELRRRGRGNSYTAWGNEKCLSRLRDTLSAMEAGTASSRQIGYWLYH
jgi:hypothetical protein